MSMENEFTLAELAARSVANPEIRRGELMTRIRGFEEVAVRVGHVADFWTVTCPSRMHSKRVGASGSTEDNPTFDCTNPREAQRYLVRLWGRVRAAWARAGVEVYGFRIAEPHHDGTPHWHVMVFMSARHRDTARDIVRRYAMADSHDEPGAERHRFKAVGIDAGKGTAAGYVSKYVAKNIDGYMVETDLFGNEAISASRRVEAWASNVGNPSISADRRAAGRGMARTPAHGANKTGHRCRRDGGQSARCCGRGGLGRLRRGHGGAGAVSGKTAIGHGIRPGDAGQSGHKRATAGAYAVRGPRTEKASRGMGGMVWQGV